jgi:hypothetical protein
LRSDGAESDVDVLPPVTTFMDEKIVVLPSTAESTTLVVLLGNPTNVVIGNCALVAPAGTVTLEGTDADPGTRENNETTTPLLPAGDGSVIVPVAVVPADTVDGLTEYDDSVGGGGGVPAGSTSRSAETVAPLPVAKIVTTVGVDTADGMSCTAAKLVPAATVAAFDRNGSTSELFDVMESNRSNDAVVDTITLPVVEPGPPPTISSGVMVNEIGVASLSPPPLPDPDSKRGFSPFASAAVGASVVHAEERRMMIGRMRRTLRNIADSPIVKQVPPEFTAFQGPNANCGKERVCARCVINSAR